MKLNENIPNKFDYLKVHSLNLILKERTNCDLENIKNMGRIDPQVYQIRTTSNMETSEVSEGLALKQDEDHKTEQVLPHRNGNVQKEECDKIEEHQAKYVTFKKTDSNGSYSKRYVSTCYLKPFVSPYWYTEILLLHIGSTRKRFDEKVYFKNKLRPYYWSENMTAEVNQPIEPTKVYSTNCVIQVEDPGEHYISLEPQQEIVKRVLAFA